MGQSIVTVVDLDYKLFYKQMVGKDLDGKGFNIPF